MDTLSYANQHISQQQMIFGILKGGGDSDV
jgi:hypothetical protein